MSKKVSIIEGQTSKHFGKTSKLQTKLRSEGYCFWVPKDESKLVTKRITKNGTYYAKNEKDINKVPYYGFSRVTVAVSNKIHGKKKENPSPPSAYNGDWAYPQNGDGNDYGYSSDDNDNVIEQALPSSIKIDTLPNKTIYNKGETIDITGIVVNGYNADGTLWGQIPFNELTFDPKVAEGGGGGGGGFPSLNTIEINGYDKSGSFFAKQCYYNSTLNFAPLGTYRATKVYWGLEYPWRGTISFTRYNGCVYMYIHGDISADNWKDWLVVFDEYGDGNLNLYGYMTSWAPFAKWRMVGGDSPNVPESSVDPTTVGPTGSSLVTVTWNRPEDHKPLTDTFNITVS